MKKDSVIPLFAIGISVLSLALSSFNFYYTKNSNIELRRSSLLSSIYSLRTFYAHRKHFLEEYLITTEDYKDNTLSAIKDIDEAAYIAIEKLYDDNIELQVNTITDMDSIIKHANSTIDIIKNDRSLTEIEIEKIKQEYEDLLESSKE